MTPLALPNKALQQPATLALDDRQEVDGSKGGLPDSALVFGARPSESSREDRGVEGFIVPQAAGQGG